MLQIKNTLGGGGANVTIDGVKVKDKLTLETIFTDLSVSTLPYTFFGSSAVVYNNEIHILGSYNGGSTSHYKWDGSAWAEVSTLPCGFYKSSAVVYNNYINLLGNGFSSTFYKMHYQLQKKAYLEVA